MTDFIKSRPWLYRALRTFFQAFLSTMAGQLMLVRETGLDEKLIMSVLVSSMAAGLSAVMNLNEENTQSQ
ncbi:MAG: hypothetical protein ACI4GA_03830 [Acutalibacteraceae bacterium]|nr:hypothetical protein [Oscillospiraceae bacterium]